MSIERFITIQAIKARNNELIPFFDPRIKWSGNDEFSPTIFIEGGSSASYYNFVECVYDLKNHTVLPGIEKEFYPKPEDMEYKVGETVLVEVPRKFNTMRQARIKDVVFEEFDMEFKRGKKLEDYHVKTFFTPDEEIKRDAVYALKTWRPSYILEDGEKINYTSKLKHILAGK